MILAVDIGNTSTAFGVYDGEKMVMSFRTDTGHYTDEIINTIKYPVKAAAVSSVVPAVNKNICNAISKNLGCQVKVIDSSFKSGISICTEYPDRVGTDIICGAAAAFYKYRKAVVVFDLGTATTVCAVDNHGNYLGHSIFPGVKASFAALHTATAKLPLIEDEYSCTQIIGKNTVSSMKSGVILGAACFIDGMSRRYRKETDDNAAVIVTGGLSTVILPYCEEKYIFDENLLMDGIRLIYEFNKQLYN